MVKVIIKKFITLETVEEHYCQKLSEGLNLVENLNGKHDLDENIIIVIHEGKQKCNYCDSCKECTTVYDLDLEKNVYMCVECYNDAFSNKLNNNIHSDIAYS